MSEYQLKVKERGWELSEREKRYVGFFDTKEQALQACHRVLNVAPGQVQIHHKDGAAIEWRPMSGKTLLDAF